MTREELKDNICGMTYDDMFEYIYELENRTCENCVYSNFIRSKQVGFCSNEEIKTFKPQLGIWFPLSMMKDFGCNRFVSTDIKSHSQD